MEQSVIERAFDVARSGKAAGVKDVEKQLLLDGYLDVRAQLSGPMLRKTLNELCRATTVLRSQPNRSAPPPSAGESAAR
ncbi:MAG: hypothetical protein JO346_06800 [Alphaproteobacteria bacterium]|nr:hypothetical protein [Alphaproteobacteria bacterium]